MGTSHLCLWRSVCLSSLCCPPHAFHPVHFITWTACTQSMTVSARRRQGKYCIMWACDFTKHDFWRISFHEVEAAWKKAKVLGYGRKRPPQEYPFLIPTRRLLPMTDPGSVVCWGCLFSPSVAVNQLYLLLNKGQQWTFNSVLQHILLWHQFVLLTVSMPYYKIQATYTEELWLITLLKSIL